MCPQNSKKMRTGGPLVVDAHKIYTLKVFSLFCELKEQSEFYRAIAVGNGLRCEVEHYDLNRVQHWCKGRYTVQVQQDGLLYSCECGFYEHFGLPCCHILRVCVSCFMRLLIAGYGKLIFDISAGHDLLRHKKITRTNDNAEMDEASTPCTPCRSSSVQ